MKETVVVCNCGIEHTRFCVDCNTDIMKKAKLDVLNQLENRHKQGYDFFHSIVWQEFKELYKR